MSYLYVFCTVYSVDDADMPSDKTDQPANKKATKYAKHSASAAAKQSAGVCNNSSPADSVNTTTSTTETGGDALLGGGPSAMISTAFTHITTVCAFSLQNTVSAMHVFITFTMYKLSLIHI